MAAGQMTFLQLTNAVLRRLGYPQTTASPFDSAAADSWPGIIKDLLNEAQREVYKEHDWSTLITSGTFTTSSRTYDLSASFSNFGREVSLTDTTNGRVLTPVSAADIDVLDPQLDDSGAPLRYSIQYPNLLFDRTPASVSFRLRYVKRPASLATNSSTSDLPEWCDMVLVKWTYWQLASTREDATDDGASAKKDYDESLSRAIGQDRRRMDRIRQLQPAFGDRRWFDPFPLPPNYDRNP